MPEDWNAKIGNNNKGSDNVMGKFGYGDQIQRRQRLLELEQ